MSEANGIPKISEDLAEHIETLPTLNTIFPYVFANSTMIDNIEIPCAACGKDIDITSIRGAVQIYPHSIAVDAYP